MSYHRKKVSEKNKMFLWGRAAGRCQYPSCNKVLWRDPAAASGINSAYVAHIIASSPNGPRGDTKYSYAMADDPSNLMLLCDVHHRLIDDEVERHSVEKLREIKKQHEQHIEYLCSLIEKPRTKIVIYSVNIGEHNSTVDARSVRNAVIPDNYPLPDILEISVKNAPQEDNQTNFWRSEIENLTDAYNRKIKPYLENPEFSHLTFFGCAPMPLLIKAGVLLSDISNVQVRQLMKEPTTWKWDEDGEILDFTIQQPSQINQGKDIALIISTSAKINHARVVSVLPNTDIWEIQASNINNDNIRTEQSLQNFRKAFRKILSDIRVSYQNDKVINIFPSMAVSIATEIGRVWNGKADFSLRIYDHNKKIEGFQEATLIE